MTTTLTGKHQVTVPAEIAREMGLEAGTRLDWARGKEPGTIVVHVQPSIRQLLDRAQELGRQMKEGPFEGRDLIAELIAERELEMGVSA
jgi:bifunctional DNA-binding transcriptional regulator/antitoxin component of YhaV-PrlF toxin-antitoxin module